MSAIARETPVRSRLEPPRTLHFGPFALDPHTLELRRDGAPVPIAPQPARLLAALASRPGELVTREELRAAVWGEGTFVDFERGLNFCVLQARTALGDEAKNPRYIETLPKRGYRLMECGSSAAALKAAAKPSRSIRAAVILLTLALVFGSRAPQTQALTSRVPAAHEAYLRGRVLWHQQETPAVFRAVDELRTAVKLDPEFVLPQIALAEALHSLAMRDAIEPREAAAEIRRASDTALRLAPQLAGAHAVTAMSRFWYEWDWDAAEESYRDAIRLDPQDAGVLHDHGWLLMTRGRFDEGIAEIRRAQALDPSSPRASTHVAWAYIYARRFDDAVREARRALELDPSFTEANACVAQVEWLSGRKPERDHKPDNPRDPYINAVRAARRGERDAAIRWLTRSRDLRQTSFALAGIDPKLEPLHGDERFVRLLGSAGLRVVRPPTR